MAEVRFALGPRLALLVAAALSLAVALVAIAAVDPDAERLTSYAAASPAARAADIAAGLGLVLAGAVAWTRPRARRVGLLATLAGLAWLGADMEGWADGPWLARSLGAATAPFLLAIMLHLTLAFPGGRLRGRPARAAIAIAYGIAAVVSVGRALFRDPLLDLYCWRNCGENAFLVHADPGLARTLGDVWLYSALVMGVALVAFGGWRPLVATTPARRILLPVLVPAMVAGAAEVAYAVALLRTPLENPEQAGFASVFFARSIATFALALGIAWSVFSARRTRASVSRLAAELGEAPPAGRLQDGLASALRDPELEVFYWLPGSERFVAGDGSKAVPLEPDSERAVTPITRAGQRLAVIVHDPALLHGNELEREIGSAARLAIDNERLQAEVLAQLEDLRASRARIVEIGDAERRRLERNLHDGAQQRLLAVSYDLRLTRAGVEHEDDPELVELLSQATREVDMALGDLRELAQGIYPAILTEAGLGPALGTFADGAPLPLELEDVPEERYAPAVEAAAYFTVEEATHDAVARGASFSAVAVARDGDTLVVRVHDDGAEPQGLLQRVADRVGALGGAVDAESTTLRVELPCG